MFLKLTTESSISIFKDSDGRLSGVFGILEDLLRRRITGFALTCSTYSSSRKKCLKKLRKNMSKSLSTRSIEKNLNS